MDTRQALPPGSALELPGMCCTIQKEIGRGSNAIVYQASYPDLLHPDETHTVLVKELFPFHPNCAIYRAEDGSIVHTAEGEECWQKHRRSFEYGNRIHLRLHRRHPELTGINWNSLSKNGTLYTVLGYTGGRSLSEEMIAPETDLRRLAIRMQLLLDALEDFHAEGYLHLDIAPDNILLIGRGRGERVMLIDYNSVHVAGNRDMEEGDAFSIKPGYTAPEVYSGRFKSVCEATDLYSVTAVFFRCLTGEALTPFQESRAYPPDVSDCPALRERPESVKAIVRQILYRGLQELPKRRFASVQVMQVQLQELIDRIDGVGVTHWALWEAGKKTVARTIRDNPAFAYLQEDELFPSDTVLENVSRLPTRQFIDGLLLPDGQNSLLTAPGGMGKTTALLRTVWLHTRRYSAGEPAMAYIPLLAYPAEATSFIVDRLLENLRFKSETQSYADARHHLRELLDQPLRTREGERPVLLLLLDGLNEVQGPTDALLKEIKELAALQGVRILITSRTGKPPDGFSGAALSPLSEENVAARLTEKGLLLPESAEMRELLRTPLMLSLFLRASLAEEKQLAVQSADDLIGAYFRSLTEKALDLPEDSPERWQTEAAVSFVLPAIAWEIQLKGRPLTDIELLPLVEKLYMLTKKKILFKRFSWIGYTAAIRGNTKNAEDWYGQIVHHILWKKLALLVRTDDGKYCLSHEIIGNYLAVDGKSIIEEINRHWVFRRLSAFLLCALLAAGGIWFAWPKQTPYDEEPASAVLAGGENAYQYATFRADGLLDITEQANSLASELCPSDGLPVSADEGQAVRKRLTSALKNFQNNMAYISTLSAKKGVANAQAGPLSERVSELLNSGDIFAGSGECFDEIHYWELLALEGRLGEDYSNLVSVLPILAEYDLIEEIYGVRFRNQLTMLAQTDAEIAETLFRLVVLPNLQEDAFDEATLRFAQGQQEESSRIFVRERLENRLQTLTASRVRVLKTAQSTAEAILDMSGRI